MNTLFPFSTIEKATLQEDVNKYYPGYANFTLGSILPHAEDLKVPTPRQNISNKKKTFNTKNIQLKDVIRLEIPKCIVLDYKKKIIPKGTVFLVGFVGEDCTFPIIIGMEDTLERSMYNA